MESSWGHTATLKTKRKKKWFSTETIGQIGVGSDGSADSETDSAMIAEEISHQHGDAI
jgi:hypothetical protein